MKPLAKTLLLGGGALLAFTAFRKKLAVDGLNVYADEKGLGARMDGITPIISFRIAIQNPSDESAQVRYFSGYVTANGYTIGNVNSFEPVVIRPNATTYMRVEARMSLLGVVSDIFNAISNHAGVSQDMQLRASMNVGGITLPVNLAYKVSF
jgi:LEA14-like dessication related protein